MVPDNNRRTFVLLSNCESSSDHELGAVGGQTHMQEETCLPPPRSSSLTEEPDIHVEHRGPGRTTPHSLCGTLGHAVGLEDEAGLSQALTLGRNVRLTECSLQVHTEPEHPCPVSRQT